MKNVASRLLVPAVVAVLLGGLFAPADPAAAQTPLTTRFTYQGHLNLTGAAITGGCDMRFTLHDASTGGNAVGNVLLFDNPPVHVSAGEFAVGLDWGAAAFDGNARWLEIAVRFPAGTGSYQVLSPRQELTATPYSLQTRGIFVDSQNRIGLGTTTPAWPIDMVAAQGVLKMTTTTSGNGSVLELKNQAANPTFLGAINFNDAAATYPGQISFSPGTYPSLNFRVTGLTPLKVTSTGLDIWTSGAAKAAASVRAFNFNLTDGVAGYFLNNSSAATAHFENNGGTGAVLDLVHNGTGHFIAATGGGSLKFWVDRQGVTHTKVLEILGGSDLSETFDVESGLTPLEPGMTVSIDPSQEGRLRLSVDAYDRRVAGIVSGAGGVNTGLLMGQKGTIASGDHPVALTGRVYCWVDAAYGAVQPGDLLTTSPTPGHAMKAQDPARTPGAVLGKAMGSLGSGRGLVLTLVGLQ